MIVKTSKTDTKDAKLTMTEDSDRFRETGVTNTTIGFIALIRMVTLIRVSEANSVVFLMTAEMTVVGDLVMKWRQRVRKVPTGAQGMIGMTVEAPADRSGTTMRRNTAKTIRIITVCIRRER
jgi:hypothetical protein